MGNKNSTKTEFTSLSSRFDSIRSSNFGRLYVTELSDDCSLIWLDANIKVDLRDKFLHIKSRLRRTFSSLTTFDDIDQCIEFIERKNQSTDSLFVITNCLFSKRMVEEIYNFQQVKRMYLFCQNINDDYEIKWFEKNSKIRNVYDDIDLMIVDLLDDLKQLTTTDLSIGLPISLFNANVIEMSTRNLNSDSTTFIWSYLFINILVQTPTTFFSKQLLLNECKSQLHNNHEELIKLQEFERTYTSEAAVRWYTRDSFLFKLVNQALRTENLSNILKFRLFVYDLHNQLKTVQGQQSFDDIEKVYRGCRMSTEEFIKLQKFVGNTIAFNTFVSTTIDRQIAMAFAGNGEDRPRLESVLFEIQINNVDQFTSYYAKIREFSYIPDEEEILFSIGTICHVITIDKIFDTNIWLVSLKLSRTINDQLKNLIEQIQNELRGPNELVTLGNYLCQLALYNDAEKHYLSLRNDSWETRSPTEQAAVLSGLIRSSIAQDKLSSATEYYNEAEELLSRCREIEVHMGKKLWIEMGNFWRERKQSFAASTYYARSYSWYFCKKAEEGCIKCDLILAEHYTNEGIMFFDYDSLGLQTSPKGALNRFELSLAIHKRILPENHLLVAVDYFNVGLAKQRIGSFKEAINHFQKALQIRQTLLPINHLQFAEIYLRLGNLYSEKKDDVNALLSYEHALYIQLMYLPRNHSAFALTYNGLGEYYQRQHDYNEAGKYFNKAYNYYPETADEDKFVSLQNFRKCQDAAQVKRIVVEGMHNHHNPNNIDASEKIATDFRNKSKFDLIDELSKENIALCIRDEGTLLRCQQTLTRSQMRILWNFLRKDCGIKTLQMLQGKICEDKNDVVLIGDALQSNTSLTSFELSTHCSLLKTDNQDISLANIRSISSAISINKTLKSLTISTLTVEGIKILADGLSNNSTLTTLNFNHNNFSSNNAFRHLIQSLHANQSIEKLSLGSTKLEYQGSVILAEMLKINRTITYLDLHENQIGTNGASMIGEALKVNRTLTYLDLSHNKINDDGMKTFGEAMLVSNPHGLQILYLRSNKLGYKGMQYLAIGLKENASLTELYLGSNKILTQGLEAIDTILMTTRKLNILELSHNEIGSNKYSSTYMYDGLRNNCSITQLDLQHNSFTGTTIRHIINALKSNRSLTILTLDFNYLGDDGAEIIGNWLIENDVLQTLSLAYNEIGDMGIRYICNALKTNHSLIKLSLTGNLISDIGASMLADALNHNTVLEELDLIYNKMTKQGIEMLEAMENLQSKRIIYLQLRKV